MQVTIRRAIFPQDYLELAQLLTAENPEWPTTPEDLTQEDTKRDPTLYQAIFLAEETSQNIPRVIGMACLGHDAWAHREGKFTMTIRVHPAMQGCGVGSHLYQVLISHLESLNPRELYTEVWEAHAHAVRFVVHRGFHEVWQRIDSLLDVSHFDLASYHGLAKHLGALGFQVKTYADLADDPTRLRKLYELDKALWQDVPFGEAITSRSLEQFARQEVQSPSFIPEACFIALQGAAFIGYSNLTQGDDYLLTEMTGVLPAYRGNGLATQLKLCGIRYAKTHGNVELRTTNDSANTAMLRLNAMLGFQRQGATIRFLKLMGRTPQFF